jgi:hypothetical protein
MKVFWEYMCDEGHQWEIFRDEDADELPPLSVCPFGHEAVTLKKCRPAKRWQTVLQPADRIVDDVIGQVAFERLFYVCLVSYDGEETARTTVRIEWLEAIKVADRVRQLSDDAALRYIQEYGRPRH